MTKRCSKCEVEQPLSEYYKQTRNRDNLTHKCKRCTLADRKEYYSENKEHVANLRKETYKKNREKILKAKKIYNSKNKEKRNKYLKYRRAKDPVFKLTGNLYSYISSVHAGTAKPASTLKLLGCTPKHYKHHIEAQFTEGMTWDNYGLKGWHIDHIQAVSLFDQTDPEQQKKCWHYTNLQPMWADQNIRKSNKVVAEYQVNLL